MGIHTKKSNQRITKKDLCQTPPYALDPIIPFLILQGYRRIWDCASGEGYLVRGLVKAGFFASGTDIMRGADFLTQDIPGHKNYCNAIVTNPPFSKKYDFLARCYEIGKPFALLMPVESLGAVTAQRLFKEYGFEWMFLDKRVDFKMPNKGWDGKGSWFPVMWICRWILPGPVMFGKIDKEDFEPDIL